MGDPAAKKDFVDYLNLLWSHKDWLFSGMGLAALAGIWRWVRKRSEEALSSLICQVAIGVVAAITAAAFLGLWAGYMVFLLGFCWMTVNFFKKLNEKRDLTAYGKAKMHEVLSYLLGDKKLVARTRRQYDCYVLDDQFTQLSTLLKDLVCKHQGLIVNYHFTGGRYHRTVKNRLQMFKQLESTKDEVLGQEAQKQLNAGKESVVQPESAMKQYLLMLRDELDELNKYLYNNLIDVIGINHKHIMTYFEGRSEHYPRIVIKGFNGVTKTIVDIYRTKTEYYTTYPVSDNTGFSHVYDKGTCFLCNDIPAKAARDQYFNPRLINQKVRDYLEAVKRGEANIDEKWFDCWTKTDYGSSKKSLPPSPESCYRSTLIIPMTLINNEGLSQEFRDHFKIPPPPSDKETGRAVYAFLCFDHRETDFFIDPIDIKMGYIFADLLSLYFIERLNYTEYSDTFNEGRRLTSSLTVGTTAR